MDARPIEVRLRRRRAGRNANAVHLEGGEKLHQTVLEGWRHLRRIGFQKEVRELAPGVRGDRSFFLEDDCVAVASFDDRLRRGPSFGVFEKYDADWLRS